MSNISKKHIMGMALVGKGPDGWVGFIDAQHNDFSQPHLSTIGPFNRKSELHNHLKSLGISIIHTM